MEILYFYFNLAAILLFFFLLCTVVRKRKKAGNQRLLPPGPWKLPLIGSMLHLIGALPHHALRNLGKLMQLLVSSPRLAKEILKVHDLSFASRPKLMASDINMEITGKLMRIICISELLSAKMVKSFGIIRQDEVHNLVISIHSIPNDVVNMSKKVFRLTSSVICRSAFGKVWDDRDNLLMITREVLSLSGGFDVEDFFPSWTSLHKISGMRSKLMSMHQKIDEKLEKIINEHKENRDMFFGGTETSSTTIQWVSSELMKNPNAMNKAQKDLDGNDLEELKYLKLVIKETLRKQKFDGYTIPLRAKVIVNGWAIGRDPESWDDPENFVPERFENSSVDFNGNHFQFIPFGAGSRMCPGMHFGLADVVYPLAQLLYHFDWHLPYVLQPKDLDMPDTCGISAARKNDLHLIATPYDFSQY
ncbi:unnamed protein product [Withania somnifera]